MLQLVHLAGGRRLRRGALAGPGKLGLESHQTAEPDLEGMLDLNRARWRAGANARRQILQWIHVSRVGRIGAIVHAAMVPESQTKRNEPRGPLSVQHPHVIRADAPSVLRVRERW